MSSDDLTRNSPKDSTTKPTIETVLERINAIGDALSQQLNVLAQKMNAMAGDVAQLRKDSAADIAQLRSEVEQGFRRVERKIGLLNNDFLAIRGDQEDVLRRVESLERQVS